MPPKGVGETGLVFQYNYTDRQSIFIFVSPASGFPVGSLANLPKARIRGGEVDLQLRPMHGFAINAGVSHLDSQVRVTLNDVDGAPLFAPVAVGSRLAHPFVYGFCTKGV